MSIAIADKIPSFKVFGLHVGDAAKGAVAAAVGDTIGTMAIRFLPAGILGSQYSGALIKGAMAAALQERHVKGFIGSDAAAVGSLILTYEALISIFNLRGKTYSLLAGLTGKMPGLTATTTAAGGAGGTAAPANVGEIDTY